MPSLSGTDVAPLYALLGVARLGATRLGYHSTKVFVNVDGVERAWGRASADIKVRDLTITDVLNDTPNTANFIAEGWTPSVGMEVIIRLGSTNNLRRLFAGTILNVEQTYIGSPARPAFAVNVIDYTWGLNKRRVFGHYTGTASEVVEAVITGYTSGYTTNNVVPGLATLDGGVTFNGDEVTVALTKIAERAPASTPWYWYCDDRKDIHFFATDPDVTRSDPAELTADNPQLLSFSLKTDLSQWITRAIVVGAGSQTTDTAPAGSTTLSLTDTSVFDPAGGSVTTPDAQIITYTGTTSLAAPSAPAGASRTGGKRSITITRVGSTATATSSTNHGYSTGDVVTQAGAAQSEYNGAFPITVTGLTTYTFAVTGTPATPATGTITAYVEIGGDVDAGAYLYKTTFTSARGETLGSSASSTVTVATVTAAGACTAAEKSPKTAGNLAVGSYAYKVAFVTSNGETLVGASASASVSAISAPGTCALASTTGGSMASSSAFAYVVAFVTASGEVPSSGYATVSTGVSDNAVSLTSIPTSADARVTARKIYRTGADYTGGYRLVTTIADNSTTTYTDTAADASLGALIPTTDTGSTGQVTLTSIPTSSDQRVIGRAIYRTAVGGSVYKRLTTISDNTTTTFADNTPDASLGLDAPTLESAGGAQVRVTSLATSADPRVVGRKVYRTTNGGTDFKLVGTLSNNTATYFIDNTSDASLATAAALPLVGTIVGLTGIPASGAGSIVTEIPDGTTVNLRVVRDDAAGQTALALLIGGDGVQETLIVDSALEFEEAEARGDAAFTTRDGIDESAHYRTTDLRTESGRDIVVNLAAPTSIAGTFKIQRVTISNFQPALLPWRQVDAAVQQVTLSDILGSRGR